MYLTRYKNKLKEGERSEKSSFSSYLSNNSIYDKQEFENYILKLQQNHQEFILESKTKYPDDKVEIKIMKQYNNNKFIERGDKCESQS